MGSGGVGAGPRRRRGATPASWPRGRPRPSLPPRARCRRALAERAPGGGSPAAPARAAGSREQGGGGGRAGGGRLGWRGPRPGLRPERDQPRAPRGVRAGQVGSGGGGRRSCPGPRLAVLLSSASGSARRLARSSLGAPSFRSPLPSPACVSGSLPGYPGLLPSPAASRRPPRSLSRALGVCPSPDLSGEWGALLKSRRRRRLQSCSRRPSRGGGSPAGRGGEGRAGGGRRGGLVISPLQPALARASTHGRSPSSLRSRGPWSPPARPPAASGRCSAC